MARDGSGGPKRGSKMRMNKAANNATHSAGRGKSARVTSPARNQASRPMFY